LRPDQSLKHEALSEKNPKHERTVGMVQVIENMPGKCEALNSNPSNAKNKFQISQTHENWCKNSKCKIYIPEAQK
jgi:hypothetical protein